MIYDRANNKIIEEKVFNSRAMKFLYGTTLGGIYLSVLRLPIVSKVYGILQKGQKSQRKIEQLIKDYNMKNVSSNYESFNDFITRKENRRFDTDKRALIAPCDSCLTINKITNGILFIVKQKEYTLLQFLKNSGWAKDFEDGYALIFRLRIYDYHRFCYPDDGLTKSKKKVSGFLDSVNISATGKFCLSSNARSISLLQTENFGDMAFVEVGAMLVGKVVDTNKNKYFKKGDEKGYFEFGGSTIVVLLKKDMANMDDDILEYSSKGIETYVKYGEKIGVSND